MENLFRTKDGKDDLLKLYDAKLASLAIDHEYQQIETSYGRTNIIVTGDASNPPLIIVHGSNGCAPIGLETYPDLHKDFQVFAVDVLGQPNKSEGMQLSMKDDTYGKWMSEVIDGLGVEDVVMAGFSLGGLIILKTLIHDERKVKEVYLSAPAYIVNGNPLKALWKIFIPMKRYMKSRDEKYVKQFLSVLFSERDEFAIKFLSKVFLEFEMDFTPVPTIRKVEARSISTPINVVAAADDIMFPGTRMIKRATRLFPSLKSSLLLSDSKHVFSKANNLIVQDLILKGL